jgi:hypothetical protein
MALAGMALLFSREWPTRMVGAILLVGRMLLGGMTPDNWLVLGVVGAAGLMLRYLPMSTPGSLPPPDKPPEADDVFMPAQCPSCCGVIPAGWNRCPACGWIYLEQED